jgi:hypothetical protein
MRVKLMNLMCDELVGEIERKRENASHFVSVRLPSLSHSVCNRRS